MNKFYVFQDGIIRSAGFDTQEECHKFGVAAKFSHFAIIKVVEYFDVRM